MKHLKYPGRGWITAAALALCLSCGSDKVDSGNNGGAGGDPGSSGAAGATAGGGVSGSGGRPAGGGGSAGTAGASGSPGTAGAGGAGLGGAAGGGGARSPDAGVGLDAARDVGARAEAGPTDLPIFAGDAGPSSSRQTARPLGSVPMAGNGFWEYLPPGYGDGNKRPLLVFLHGVGENGDGSATDLRKVLAHGPPKIINQNRWPADRPFVVLSAQHAGGGCPSATEVRDFFTMALARYQIDDKRVYLTGLSCGAIGSWGYLGRFRGMQVAAAALIAGDGRSAWTQAMCNLGELGVWALHGDVDDAVNVMGSTVPLTNLMKCPMPPRKDARLTIYPGVGHDSWTRTYDGSAGNDIYTWFLQFSR